jgi:hypothetical protein
VNPAILTWMLRATAVAVQVKTNGLTSQLRDELVALADEAKDSLLEPQESGAPWTDEAILAWKAELDANVAAGLAIHRPSGPDGHSVED